MAAPSGIVWGSKVGDYGRIGIYKSITSTNTQSTLTVEVWIGTKYSVSDTNNTLYFDDRASSGSATTDRGSKSINTTVASGTGWSDSNERKLYTYTKTYDRGASDVTRYLCAKLANVDRVGGTMYVSTTATIPKLATYTVTYNANGGSGAPGAQTKTYGKALTLSSTKPTRTDYKFLGWSASKTATTATYKAGGAYAANNAITLYAVWELAYVKPTIKSLTVSRHVSNGGDQSDSGTWARVRFSWTTFNKTPTITVKIGSDTYSVTGLSGTSGAVDTYVDASLNPDTTYSVTVTVNDGTESVSSNKNLTGAKYVMDLLKGGNGAAFGKAAEKPGYVDNNFKTYLRDNVELENGMCVYGALKDNSSTMVGVFQPLNANNNTVIGYGNYDRYVNDTNHTLNAEQGNTNIYGNNINFGVANNGSSSFFKPYYSKGDAIENIDIHTAGYVTSGKSQVCFVIPLYKPVVGTASIILTSSGGFTLRQDGLYTHGSSWDSTNNKMIYTYPDSYVATIDEYGIVVKAIFKDLTNAVNNAPIGICWNGTIEFN